MKDMDSPWSNSLFFEEVQAGHRFERYVAKQLLRYGIVAVVQEQSMRNSYSEAIAYANTQDIICEGFVNIEVKSRRRKFHGVEDFPDDTIFVDTVRKWRLKRPKPWFYAIVSQVTGAIIAIRGHDPSRWKVQRKHDPARGYTDEFYAADKSEWRDFGALVRALHWIRNQKKGPEAARQCESSDPICRGQHPYGPASKG